MPPGRAAMAADPVIAAGIGVRLGRGYAVRAGSFRLTGQLTGQLTGRSVLRSGLRQLALGGLAIGVTFAVGSLIGSGVT